MTRAYHMLCASNTRRKSSSFRVAAQQTVYYERLECLTSMLLRFVHSSRVTTSPAFSLGLGCNFDG